MHESRQSAISVIRELGSVEELSELAEKGCGPKKRAKGQRTYTFAAEFLGLRER